MPERRRHPQDSDRDHLAECWRDVDQARRRLHDARGSGNLRWEEHPLRVALLAALEGYAAAISRAGAPVPYRLRAEIELYRGLRNRR